MHVSSVSHRKHACHAPTITLCVALLTTAFAWALMPQAPTVQRTRENQPQVPSAFLGINSLDASAKMSLAATNAWSSNGPQGSGGVNSLAVDPTDPNVIYAGTNNGVFKSNDDGASWIWCSSGTAFIPITQLVIDPNTPATIYAVGDSYQVSPGFSNFVDGGVLKSVDAGATWSRINFSFTQHVRHWAISKSNSLTLYAATSPSGIYKSVDGGASWNPRSTGLPGSSVSSLVVDPTSALKVYAIVSGNIYKTSDGGSTWSPLTNTFSVSVLLIDPINSSTLYGATRTGLYKSFDAGANWEQIALAGANLSAVAIDPRFPNVLYAQVDEEVRKSTDSGITWTPTGFQECLFYMIVNPNNSVVYGLKAVVACHVRVQQSGIVKSANGGAGWITTNLLDIVVTKVVVDPTSPTTVYARTNYGMFKSIDSGMNWIAKNQGFQIPLDFGTGNSGLAIDTHNTNTLYVSARGLFKTVNAGDTWTSLPFSCLSVHGIAIDPTNSQVLYASSACDGKVYKSTNAGMTWNPSATSLAAGGATSFTIHPANPNTIYAGFGAVFKSIDGGAHWTNVSGSQIAASIKAVVIDPANPNTIYAAGFEQFASDNGGIYKSVAVV